MPPTDRAVDTTEIYRLPAWWLVTKARESAGPVPRGLSLRVVTWSSSCACLCPGLLFLGPPTGPHFTLLLSGKVLFPNTASELLVSRTHVRVWATVLPATQGPCREPMGGEGRGERRGQASALVRVRGLMGWLCPCEPRQAADPSRAQLRPEPPLPPRFPSAGRQACAVPGDSPRRLSPCQSAHFVGPLPGYSAHTCLFPKGGRPPTRSTGVGAAGIWLGNEAVGVCVLSVDLTVWAQTSGRGRGGPRSAPHGPGAGEAGGYGAVHRVSLRSPAPPGPSSLSPQGFSEVDALAIWKEGAGTLPFRIVDEETEAHKVKGTHPRSHGRLVPKL